MRLRVDGKWHDHWRGSIRVKWRIAGMVNLLHIKMHYYGSYPTINPARIVPVGPELNYSAPHNRGRFAKAA